MTFFSLSPPALCCVLNDYLQLPVYASGPAIPDYLMMDLRGMRIGEKVMASQIELNEGLRLVRGASYERAQPVLLHCKALA